MSDGTQYPCTTWRVDAVISVTDGDTVRILRSRELHWDGRDYILTDADDVHGVPHRLVWVDTPERGDHPGWENGRTDLAQWCSRALGLGPITALVYGSAGWDRLLVDLHDANGESCSEWMMQERGWPPYVAH